MNLNPPEAHPTLAGLILPAGLIPWDRVSLGANRNYYTDELGRRVSAFFIRKSRDKIAAGLMQRRWIRRALEQDSLDARYHNTKDERWVAWMMTVAFAMLACICVYFEWGWASALAVAPGALVCARQFFTLVLCTEPQYAWQYRVTARFVSHRDASARGVRIHADDILRFGTGLRGHYAAGRSGERAYLPAHPSSITESIRALRTKVHPGIEKQDRREFRAMLRRLAIIWAIGAIAIVAALYWGNLQVGRQLTPSHVALLAAGVAAYPLILLVPMWLMHKLERWKPRAKHKHAHTE